MREELFNYLFEEGKKVKQKYKNFEYSSIELIEDENIESENGLQLTRDRQNILFKPSILKQKTEESRRMGILHELLHTLLNHYIYQIPKFLDKRANNIQLEHLITLAQQWKKYNKEGKLDIPATFEEILVLDIEADFNLEPKKSVADVCYLIIEFRKIIGI